MADIAFGSINPIMQLFIRIIHMSDQIAKKRQQRRQAEGIYTVSENTDKPKYYVLDMFPYPSGSGLHVGHPKGYVATDVAARMKMLQGYNVLHPMGFDAFGLPAEQFAIKNKVNPAVSTAQNVARYKEQLEMMGFTYDRSREVNTTDPKFYKWTQWIFLQLYGHYFDHDTAKAKPVSALEKQLQDAGKTQQEVESIVNGKRLAFVDYKPINWCPSCKTGLANEDLEGGKCERCGSEVEQKPMRQRVLRITDYAQRLLDGLEELTEWPANVKEMQRNWIGKSEGTQFKMQIAGFEEFVEIYTTRIDTVYGVSFVAMAPEHPLLASITSDAQRNAVADYVEQAKNKTELQRTGIEKDKTGVRTGAYAINPFTGEQIPIWIADYVLGNFGTGAVMGVPAHDERDYAFAKKYDLTIVHVVAPVFGEPREDEIKIDGVTTILFDPHTQEYGYLHWFNHNRYVPVCGGLDGQESHEAAAQREVQEETGIPAIQKIHKLGDSYYSRYYHYFKKGARFAKVNPYLCIVDKTTAQDHSREDHEEFEVVRSDAQTMLHNLEKTIPDSKHLHEACRRAITSAVELGYDTSSNAQKFQPMFVDTDYGILYNSGIYSDMFVSEAIPAMQQRLSKQGIGGKKIQYKLQDRVFSRQRYWGEPIPMMHVEGKIQPLDEKDLPLELPMVENYEPTGTQEGPLAAIDERVNVTLNDGRPARRETNTMPQRAGSSRYWLRYMDPMNDKQMLDPHKEEYRGQVDTYVGGLEHATRHLIYARFWHKFLYDIGVVSTSEPFKKLYGVGLVLGEDGQKMSKRRGNVVNPDEVIAAHGADAFRVYEMFMGPFENEVARSTAGVKGVKKFLDKVVQLFVKIDSDTQDTKQTLSLLHKTIKKVSEDIEGFRFNTAVSQLMILVNHLIEQEKIARETYRTLVILLAPFAPHIAEEMREKLGMEFSVFTTGQWPQADESLLVDELVTIAVQVNGKMKGTVNTVPGATQDDIMTLVQENESLKSKVAGEIKKIIYVPGKIVNIIV